MPVAALALARAARHARGRGIGLRGHRAAPARVAVQAGLHARFGRAALPCLSARRAGGLARLSSAPGARDRGRALDRCSRCRWCSALRSCFPACSALAPGLFIALILQASAPPVISSPTFAALLRHRFRAVAGDDARLHGDDPVHGAALRRAFHRRNDRHFAPLALGLRLAAIAGRARRSPPSSSGSVRRQGPGRTPEGADRRPERHRAVRLRRRA